MNDFNFTALLFVACSTGVHKDLLSIENKDVSFNGIVEILLQLI